MSLKKESFVLNYPFQIGNSLGLFKQRFLALCSLISVQQVFGRKTQS